ncbi:MAG: DUF3372 domain-containing protein, partial [Burkholderiaceae bacterium]|nr:DUF3372 domain-containing protein [Burkholderiaceae bacterium]
MPASPQRATAPFSRLTLGAALVLSAFGAQAQQAQQPIPQSACEAPHQTVLQGAAAQYDARAVWLDRTLLKWPGVDASATYHLYYSVAGTVNATVGGKVSGADGSVALLRHSGPLDAATAQRFNYVADGAVLALPANAKAADLLKQQLVLVRQGPDGSVLDATTIQAAGALDDLYAAAEKVADLGATPARGATRFKVWAPTAHNVAVCTYDNGYAKASAIEPMRFDAATGVWSTSRHADLSGKYYTYVVDVNVPNTGLVRNLVTDPYAVSLTTDSLR